MWQFRWDAIAPSLIQTLATTTIFCVVWTLVGMFVMKYFVRQVPLLGHAVILFWATLRVQIVALALLLLCRAFNISVGAFLPFFGVLATCAVGWLVTRDLATRYAVSANFPGVGFKLMATMVVFTGLLVVAIIVITGA